MQCMKVQTNREQGRKHALVLVGPGCVHVHCSARDACCNLGEFSVCFFVTINICSIAFGQPQLCSEPFQGGNQLHLVLLRWWDCPACQYNVRKLSPHMRPQDFQIMYLVNVNVYTAVLQTVWCCTNLLYIQLDR